MTAVLRLLAFDTSTDALSVAVSVGAQVWRHDDAGGAKASATLIPVVQRLLADAGTSLASLDALAFGRGPGSFTGLRTACAVAQGLAYGAQARGGAIARAETQSPPSLEQATPPPGPAVLAVDTLLALAEDARARHGIDRVVAVLDARMEQVYWAHWRHDGRRWLPGAESDSSDGDSGNVDDGASGSGSSDSSGSGSDNHTITAPANSGLCAPQDLPVPAGWPIAGNAHAAYGARLAPGVPHALRLDALPAACALLRLAPALLVAGAAVPPHLALPRYVRDRVAQTTAERALAAAARQAQPQVPHR